MSTLAGPARSRGRRSSRPTAEDREQAILATAARLLEEKPYAEISVDDLAKGAGLSRPTFYFYFQSKEAVLLSLLEPLIQHADSGFDGAMLTPVDPRRAFQQGITTFFTAFSAYPVLARAGTEALSASPELRTVWSGLMAKWIDQTTALIMAERARGVAPETIGARELATSLNLMNERTMIAALSAEEPAVAAELVVETLTHIWLTSIYGLTP